MKFGPWEIALILVIILIVFGVGKLPDIGRQFGKGIRDFKKFSSGAEDEPSASAKAGTEPDAKAKMAAAEAKIKALEESTKKSA